MGGPIILDLCGGTGSWSEPYRLAGYDVRLVTLPDADVRTYVPPVGVRGVLCAPPCDHFAGSGARWWAGKDADGRTAEAVGIVRACLRIVAECSPVWWALENPAGRIARLVPELGRRAYSFHPCDHGDAWTKRTILWGSFSLPARTPVEPVFYESAGKRGSWAWAKLGGKSERTKRLRSATPPGFARAFFEANR